MKYGNYNVIHLSIYTEGDLFKISNDDYEILLKLEHGIGVIEIPNLNPTTGVFDKISDGSGFLFSAVLNGANNTPTPLLGFIHTNRTVSIHGLD